MATTGGRRLPPLPEGACLARRPTARPPARCPRALARPQPCTPHAPIPPPTIPQLPAPGVAVAQLSLDLSGPAAPGAPGCGPRRVWPGGARLSRALGDTGAGQAVLPYPHVRQVWLPPRPSRLILATEGVWEAFETHHKAAALIQAMSAENAAPALVAYPARKGCRSADRSAVVVDFVPRPAAPSRTSSGGSSGSRSSSRSDGGRSDNGGDGSFKKQVRLDRLSRASQRSGGFGSGRATAAAAPPLPALARRPPSAQGSSASLGTLLGGGSSSGAVSPTTSWLGSASTGVSLGALTSRSASAVGATAAAASDPTGAALRRARSAHALFASLLPRCVTPRAGAAAASAAVVEPGAPGDASSSALTVARLDAFETYAGGRYGALNLVLTALDAALRAAAAAEAAAAAPTADATATVVPAAAACGEKPAGARCSGGRFVLGRASRSLGDVVAGPPGGNAMLRPSIALTE
jgi:hypothetical protein